MEKATKVHPVEEGKAEEKSSESKGDKPSTSEGSLISDTSQNSSKPDLGMFLSRESDKILKGVYIFFFCTQLLAILFDVVLVTGLVSFEVGYRLTLVPLLVQSAAIVLLLSIARPRVKKIKNRSAMVTVNAGCVGALVLDAFFLWDMSAPQIIDGNPGPRIARYILEVFMACLVALVEFQILTWAVRRKKRRD